jgi:hypothetical protein
MVMVNAAKNNPVIPTKVGITVFAMQGLDQVILHQGLQQFRIRPLRR